MCILKTDTISDAAQFSGNMRFLADDENDFGRLDDVDSAMSVWRESGLQFVRVHRLGGVESDCGP